MTAPHPEGVFYDEIKAYADAKGFYANGFLDQKGFTNDPRNIPTDLYERAKSGIPGHTHEKFSATQGYSPWIHDVISYGLQNWMKESKPGYQGMTKEAQEANPILFKKEWSLFKSYVEAYLGNTEGINPYEIWFAGSFTTAALGPYTSRMVGNILGPTDSGADAARQMKKHADIILTNIQEKVKANEVVTATEGDLLAWAASGMKMELYYGGAPYPMWGGPDNIVYKTKIPDNPTLEGLRLDENLAQDPGMAGGYIGRNLLMGADKMSAEPGGVYQDDVYIHHLDVASDLADAILLSAMASEHGLRLLSPRSGHIFQRVVDENCDYNIDTLPMVSEGIQDLIHNLGTPKHGKFSVVPSTYGGSTESGPDTVETIELRIAGSLYEMVQPINSKSGVPGSNVSNPRGGTTGTWWLKRSLYLEGEYYSNTGIPGWAVKPAPNECPDKPGVDGVGTCSPLADVGGFNSTRVSGENIMVFPKQVIDHNFQFIKSLQDDESISGDFTKYPFKWNKMYSSNNENTEITWQAILAYSVGGSLAVASVFLTGGWSLFALGAGASAIFSGGLLDYFWGNPPDITMNEYLAKVNKMVYFLFLKKILAESVKPLIEQEFTIKEWHEKYMLNPDHIKRMATPILVDKEIGRRKAKWQSAADQAAELETPADVTKPDDIIGDDDDELEAMALAAIAGFREGKSPPVISLDVEDIKERQKFFKQCALMLNAHVLRTHLNHRLQGETNVKKGKYPFNGRFWMAECEGDQERLITNLVAGEGCAEFFEVPPRVMTYLTPKCRLYKVTNKNQGELHETEFVFDTTTDINRSRNYTRPQPGGSSYGTQSPGIAESYGADTYDKGDGCGLQEFSIQFQGTTPATARNDITAQMKLFFQSFPDFIRERRGYNGRTYRYVDLVLQPKPDKEGMINNLKIIHPHQYDPSFYRIRAEVGYNIPGATPPIAYKGWDKLRTAISLTNRSYYLNMVDHDIDVNADGTVVITINYRAYVETALKTSRFDALSTPELIKRKEANAKKLQNLLSNESCSAAQLKELKSAMAGQEDQLKAQTMRSILSRLLKRDRIYVLNVNEADATHFRKRGYFDGCRLQVLDTAGGRENLQPYSPQKAMASSTDILNGVERLSEKLTSKLPAEELMLQADMKDTIVQFFFFGDLLHTILDTMYDTKGKLIQGMENTRMILGSLDFDTFNKGSVGTRLNIAHLPISLDFFNRWFEDNILGNGKPRKAFPILKFIRNLATQILQKSILENCVNQKLKKTTGFHTGQISAYTENRKVDPLQKLVNQQNIIINTDAKRGKGLPLQGDTDQEIRDKSSKGTKANHFYNYLILNTLGSSRTFTGSGKYLDDIKSGRFHIDIGSNKGIVKTVKFSKTDQKYTREARFLQNGIDGLLQLSEVYKITVDMFGNSMFYPGMELFLNPYGLGGTAMGSPTQGSKSPGGRSLANKLGIGGYHTIDSVKTTLRPGNFSTSITAYQYYAGDGSGNPNIDGGVNVKVLPPVSLEETRELANDKQSEEKRAACKKAILEAEWGQADLTDDDNSLGNDRTPSQGRGGTGTTTVEDEPGPTQDYLFAADTGNVTFQYNQRQDDTDPVVYSLNSIRVATIRSFEWSDGDVEFKQSICTIFDGVFAGEYVATWEQQESPEEDWHGQISGAQADIGGSETDQSSPGAGSSTGETDEYDLGDELPESEVLAAYKITREVINYDDAIGAIDLTGNENAQGTITIDGKPLSWGWDQASLVLEMRRNIGMYTDDIFRAEWEGVYCCSGWHATDITGNTVVYLYYTWEKVDA